MEEDFDLPDDLKDDVEIVHLDEGEYFEDDEYEDEVGDAEQMENDVTEADVFREEVIDVSKLTFFGHKSSVFASALSKDGTLAITGGEDDMAYLWSTLNAEILFECTGHKDSVTHVGFSYDDQYIVTGDMGGLIQVWSVKEKKLIWCYEGEDLEWLNWHQMSNIIFAGCHSGDVYMFQIPQGNCKVMPSHGAASTCGSLLSDGKLLIVGYNDGLVKLWSLKEAKTIWLLSDPQITTIDNIAINDDGSLGLLTPSAHLFKLLDGKILSVLLIDGETEIEFCSFNNELGVVATGALSGQLCLWELGKHILRHQAKIESSATILKFAPNGKLLVAATDGVIYVCDVRSGQLCNTLTGHKLGILSLCLERDGNYVMSTSDDGTAKIYNLNSE